MLIGKQARSKREALGTWAAAPSIGAAATPPGGARVALQLGGDLVVWRQRRQRLGAAAGRAVAVRVHVWVQAGQRRVLRRRRRERRRQERRRPPCRAPGGVWLLSRVLSVRLDERWAAVGATGKSGGRRRVWAPGLRKVKKRKRRTEWNEVCAKASTELTPDDRIASPPMLPPGRLTRLQLRCWSNSATARDSRARTSSCQNHSETIMQSCRSVRQSC